MLLAPCPPVCTSQGHDHGRLHVDGGLGPVTAFGHRVLVSALVKRHYCTLSGIGQLVALDLIYVSGEKSQPEPGELTDLTAQHFIRFEPENLQSTASKLLIIRNTT